MMKAMKETHTHKPISIPPDIPSRCVGPGQADKMDRLFRAVLTVPHSAVLQDTAKRQKARAKARKA